MTSRTARSIALAGAGAAALALLGLASAPSQACRLMWHHYHPISASVKEEGHRWRVTMNFYRRALIFKGSSARVRQVIVLSRQERVARWLAREVRSSALWAAIRSPVQRRDCRVLGHGRLLARLETRLGRGLAAVYRRATRRPAGHLDVMLSVANAESCRIH